MADNPWIDLSAFVHCPSCGQAELDAFVVNGRRCRRCGFEFFENVAAAVAVLIVDAAGRGLFTVRAKDPAAGMLDLPGGFVDPGEGAEDAARREIREELGIDLGAIRYAGSAANRYAYRGVVYATSDVFFTTVLPDGARLRALDDIAGFEWRELDTIQPDEIAFVSIRNFIDRFTRVPGDGP